MREGGRKLSEIKLRLGERIKPGVSAFEIEELADSLINKTGGEASFKTVGGYKYATCVNVNAGVVHGIPKKDLVFEDGDIVSVDVGIFYKGFHTDTSLSVLLGKDNKKARFLEIGTSSLKKAIKEARRGKRIWHISRAMEKTLTEADLYPVRSLVGHGVGRNLHEEPQIPCFTYGKPENTPKIVEGMVFAIEVIYTQTDTSLVVEDDGWTISTRDGKISGLFEETVAVTKNGPLVIT